MHNIQIEAVLNGWVCQVGCQRIVYNDRRTLLNDLDDYLRDPVGTHERIVKGAANAPLLMPLAPPPPCETCEPSCPPTQQVVGSPLPENRRSPSPAQAR
jgi:hypothetical protein